MELKYKNSCRINRDNTAFYGYWNDNLPAGLRKGRYFGLIFLKIARKIINHPLGIKIVKHYETEV